MLTAGLDEVGWGSPAGPLVSVVAVVQESDLAFLPKGVTDSKKLTDKKREMFFEQICAAVTDVGLGSMEPWEIDKIGPYCALQESYKRALSELRVTPDVLIVDGKNRVQAFKGQQIIEPKADLNHKSVSIASIIAKVVRDWVMNERAARFRKLGLDYAWEQNKGYLTKSHMAGIEKHGLLFGPDQELYQHRRSYCSDLLGKVKIYGR